MLLHVMWTAWVLCLYIIIIDVLHHKGVRAVLVRGLLLVVSLSLSFSEDGMLGRHLSIDQSRVSSLVMKRLLSTCALTPDVQGSSSSFTCPSTWHHQKQHSEAHPHSPSPLVPPIHPTPPHTHPRLLTSSSGKEQGDQRPSVSCEPVSSCQSTCYHRWCSSRPSGPCCCCR